ncbi:hypothetical protein HNR46_000041 [Haloferula luteola]|uniref:Uncharacterized protein n=1 Tax=Haloferula luteola TaxID=595692 RepID=A0A840V793_9BACT|nr:hypothetical protein [Haloferula luteola]
MIEAEMKTRSTGESLGDRILRWLILKICRFFAAR